MRSLLIRQNSHGKTVKTVKKPTNLITEEMADDYAAFLLDLWHYGQMVHKINKKGEVSMDEE